MPHERETLGADPESEQVAGRLERKKVRSYMRVMVTMAIVEDRLGMGVTDRRCRWLGHDLREGPRQRRA
jgi:hypothetical protein